MSTTTTKTRKLHLEMMTRVEGEGGISVELQDGELKHLTMDIFEPPRLFEGFLRGRSIEEVPDITARICGICPVAYQFTSAQAIEAGLGITLSPEIRRLRQLLYLGEWIQSHALHIYFLQLPDLLGFPDALTLAQVNGGRVKEALRLKQIGNRVMDLVGGRSIHPINVCIGGFYHAPSKDEVRALRADLEWALLASIRTVELIETLHLPTLERPVELVSLSRDDEYAFLDGTLSIGSKSGIPVKEFPSELIESHVPQSNALYSTRSAGGSYFVGPLARIHFNHSRLSPRALGVYGRLRFSTADPYAGILARAIELIHACETALQIVDGYIPPDPPRVPFELHAGEGHGASEAPRGTLYHRYRFDERGLVESARIVPPTAQNYVRMEDDLRLLVPTIADRADAEILAECEKLIRCYDPCISCSVHAIKLKRS